MNKKIIMFSLFILSFLLIFSAVSSATDNFNQTMIIPQQSSSVENSIDEMNDENIGSTEKSSKTIKLDSTNFDEYVTNGKFNENVSEGDTIDITGKLDGSRFALEIDKAVNIVSSNSAAYINFDTRSTSNDGSYYNGIFQISKGGAGTNITGISFHNTRVCLYNTSNVMINNISCINNGQSIGKGVGAFTVREGSENITVTNSFFMTRGNGGHSNVVFAAAYNCLFENNTVEGYGDQGFIGNLLYLTTYNVKSANPNTNINITIRNNKIYSYDTDSFATCWGLVLEGSGHVIEGNIINNLIRSQYADEDYDFETDINGIIFNNNTLLRTTAELTFPGIVSNNTFYGPAILKQVYAYNNNFNKLVTIQSNVKFENNTANTVTITGDNNVLENNEGFTDEDYAIIVSGNNNTLSNNRLASYLGRGENAISNSTEIISINNSEEINRVYIFNDENWEKYLVLKSRRYTTISNFLKSNDIVILNITPSEDNSKQMFNDNFLGTTDSIIIISNTLNPVTKAKMTILNSTILVDRSTSLSTSKEITLINSTVARIQYNPVSINSSVLTGNYFITSNNHYVLTEVKIRSNDEEDIAITDEGLLELTPYSHLDVYRYTHFQAGVTFGSFKDNLYLNVPLVMTGVGDISGLIDTNFSFIDGSEYTTVENIIFNKSVKINSKNINFYNCTFNGDVEVNNESVVMENNVFNGKISLNNANKLLFNNNIINIDEIPINIIASNLMTFENNTIITTVDNTIIFDEESSDNEVRNNLLIAGSLVGDDTVIAGDNIVEDNGPSYNTSIEIVADETLFKNDVSNVTVTVYNLLNNTPVDRGYVEVYLDGVLQGIKTLTDGKVSVEVNTNQSTLGNVPLKVWYYDGIRYSNNVTTKTVNVAKSNVTINVDEFTAKLNEKAGTKITFTNQKDNHVQDTNVTVTVGHSSFTVETVDGVATLDEMVTKEWLDAGKITVSFPSTDAYNANSTTITLNTSKADVLMVPMVSVDGNVADVYLTLRDDLEQNVTDGRIVLSTLDGQELASGRVSNGKFISNVALPEGYSDEYLVANFTGSYYYNDFVRNVKITQMLNSTVSLETNSPLYGEELVINGKLVDSKNTPISGANLTLNLNGSKVIVTTNDDGEYTYTYTPGLGVNSLTVTFDGTVDIYGSSASKDVTIRDTDREMNEVLDRLDELTSENAKLKEQLENLTQLSNDLKEQLANQISELSEQNAALQQQINTLSTIISALTGIIDKQNEQIAALTAPENTTIVLNQVTDAKYKANVVISGMLNSQKGMALSGQTVTLTIGDKTVDVTTKNGEFEYTTVFKSVGEQTVTASYAGSDNYVASDASVTFDVAKQDVVVTVDPIADSAYGDNVTITGKFSDVDGNAISNSNVRVFVNGKKFLAKTDKTGIYTLSVKVNALGENNVTVGYAGNDNYNSYEDTTTFKADKQDVIVTVDAIEDTKVGENVTITGTFTDKNGKAIINSNVKILINGKKYYARTDSTGSYTFTTTVTSAGMNNVTLGYSGNDKYNSYEDITTFNVEAQDVIVTVNPIEEVAVGDNITITGTFTDKYGKVIINSNVKILFNGKKYYARTDSTGTYTFTTTVTTEGINNITVGYAGSAKYNAYETSTTFIAKAE